MRNVAHNFEDWSEIDERDNARKPRPTAQVRQRWREARQFQIRAQKALKGHAFFEWLLLETLQELLDETGDAVSQAAIAERAGLTKMMTSYWMSSMEEYGLVDRGPALDGRSYRIYLGERGAAVLRECNERLEAAGLRE
jgi:DNA-binding MarR family transcriptional regulator